MKFDELEKHMRAYESARDPHLLGGIHIVARIDGRSFTRLTGDIMGFKKPYDETFRDHMIATLEHLVSRAGFKVTFGYTQSDEISLLFPRDEVSFDRNIRKWTSILAGEASGMFCSRLGRPAAFDCRLIELPTDQLVVDYFRWRNEDAHRNALNAWTYWKLREEGKGQAEATKELEKLSVAQKNELLWQRGINFNDLPLWQRRGVGAQWLAEDKAGVNPKTGAETLTSRRKLTLIDELPMRDDFDSLIRSIL